MDTSTIVACLLGALLIFGVVAFGGQEGGAPFWNAPALLIVFGGTATAIFIAFPMKTIFKSVLSVKKCFAKPRNDSSAIIDQLVFFAESVRREGLLAQENRLDEIHDSFLAEGLRLIVDGLPPTTVESILNNEIEAEQHRHQQIRNIVLHCGKYAPAFGMIGTLIGLVLMLTQLDAATVGPGMAVAVLTTLYGLIAANLIFMPIAEKLKQQNETEMRIKAMIVRGILAIQAGEHPRIIQMKLQTFLTPEERSNKENRVIIDDAPTIPFPVGEDEEMDEKVA